MSSKIIDNLVSSAKNGSAEAFGELYEMYSKDMFRFAYYYLGSSLRPGYNASLAYSNY